MAQCQMGKSDATGTASGLMVKAAAYIAKYQKDGPKVRLRCSDSGVHKKNRGGEYPSGLRGKELLVELAKIGIIQDEVDHHGYAVEELPLDKVLDCKDPNFISTLEYNVRECAKDEWLSGIYDEPYNKVFYSFLAHNHVLTICRAVITKQLWRLDDIQDMKITFCDEDGRLSLELIASAVNCVQLKAIIHEGVLCKVLSYKMDLEEPGAAATISTAVNELNRMAMHTTEIQAFKVLQGEIILQMSKEVGQTVAFQTTLVRVKSILGPAANDPDIVQLFDFLISNGVGKNSYIDDFLHWATVSVNPNKRRLRFAAFTPINNMRPLPLTQCAVAKRAYRGKPTAGYCPNPESAWGSYTTEQLTPLEDLLRFFHVGCKDLLDEMLPTGRLQILGNVDIAAAEAFHLVAVSKSSKRKSAKEFDSAVKDGLLKATQPWASELKLHGSSSRMGEVTGKPEWVVFGAEEALLPAVAASASKQPKKTEVKANIIHFDEASGIAMGSQVTHEAEEQRPISIAVEQTLPWQAWQKVYAEPAEMHGGDYGSAVAVLHTLAYGFNAETVPLEEIDRNGKVYVRATRRIPAHELMLAPSTANGCSLVDSRKTAPELAVDIAVRVQMDTAVRGQINSFHDHVSAPQEESLEPSEKKRKKAERKLTAEKKAAAEDQVELATEYVSERFFKLAPEWKMPALTTAAANATQAESSKDRDTVDGNSLWPPASVRVYKVERSIDDYSFGDAANVTRGFCHTNAAMSAYWAIRRVSASELELANKMRSKTQSFNCIFEKQRLVNVSVGLVNKQMVNVTRNVEVPFITNAIDVEAGEELLLEKPVEAPTLRKPTKGKHKQWKTAATNLFKKAEPLKGEAKSDQL